MEFLSPRYLADVHEVLDRDESHWKICAGMTHVLRFYSKFPEGLAGHVKGILHVGDMAALSECREELGRYVVGATSRIASLQSDPYLARYAPALIDAAQATSTPQIRNQRTVGGEIAWGSYHSPLIATLLALQAKVRVRWRGEKGTAGHEDVMELSEFFESQRERVTPGGKKLICRGVKLRSHDLIEKIVLPQEILHRTGSFSFFKALNPKISTENSGVVVAVSGVAQNGVIHSAHMVASGLWMWTLSARLPLEGVRMSDAHIFEKLYAFCDRYSFENVRREEGPSGNQLGLVVFGLLKEGFSGLLGR